MKPEFYILYESFLALNQIILDSGLKCHKEILTKVTDDFGHKTSATAKEIPGFDIKDCKRKCERDENCLSIKHCQDTNTCTLYDAGATSDVTTKPNSDTCGRFVKSCGLFT